MEIDIKRKDMFLVPVNSIIVEEGFNTRIDYGDLESLKNSIIENGIITPLKGYKDKDKYVLTEGHRRIKAVKMAIEDGHEILRVPILTEKITSKESRTFEILINNDGKPLTPIELANTYDRLVVWGYSVQEIAKKIGKSVQHVKDTLELMQATKKTTEMIANGHVTANAVKKMLKSDSPEVVEKKIEAVVSGKALTGKPLVSKNNVSKELIGKKVVTGHPTIQIYNYEDFKSLNIIKEPKMKFSPDYVAIYDTSSFSEQISIIINIPLKKYAIIDRAGLSYLWF